MEYCIYITKNLVNGNYYIGKATVERIQKGYQGSGRRLKEAIRKYGKQNFQTDIIERFSTESEAFEAEHERVTLSEVLNPQCYNLRPGGEGGSAGYLTYHKGSKEIRIPKELEEQVKNQGYQKGRSFEAFSFSPEIRKEVIKKSQKTLIDRYGGITVRMNTPEVLAKMKESRQRHAREYLHSSEVSAKSQETRKRRYGTTNGAMNTPEAMEKKGKTRLLKYGSKMGAANLPEIRKKALETRKKNNQIRREIVGMSEFQEWWKNNVKNYRGPFYAVPSFLREIGKNYKDYC